MEKIKKGDRVTLLKDISYLDHGLETRHIRAHSHGKVLKVHWPKSALVEWYDGQPEATIVVVLLDSIRRGVIEKSPDHEEPHKLPEKILIDEDFRGIKLFFNTFRGQFEVDLPLKIAVTEYSYGGYESFAMPDFWPSLDKLEELHDTIGKTIQNYKARHNLDDGK